MNEKQNPLKDKSFQFALKIIKLYTFLSEQKREYVMSKQLLRSGTSIGANIREAQNAQSKADFIHKLSISQKECDETLYWLELLHQSGFLEEKRIHNNPWGCQRAFKNAPKLHPNNKTKQTTFITHNS